MTSPRDQQQYTKVETSEAYADSSSNPDSEDTLYPDTESLLHNSQHATRTRPRPVWQTFLCVSISILALALSALGGAYVGSKWLVNPDRLCSEYTNSYSPVVKDIDIKYSTIGFNGSLLRPNEYRQEAGPEVDAAWEALGVDYHAVRIPVSEGPASGLSNHVQIHPKHGGGYPANVEGLHQLHCLNLLRKSSYYNYDHYHAMGKGPFANEDRILRLHVTHCLDIIRQQLMCTTDTGVLGQIWINPEKPEAYVDFNTQHRCKNFDAIREWAKERMLPDKIPEDFLLPPGSHDTIYGDIP